eukprot:gb/GECG01012343.1/.p1 GENE.gb/GECG01012343.1/~~gb/GECG01012343.1/.p1  ORF type:complete len:173 (+),score=11.73 gb/GECG01012343.1/:1-519(+)
MRGEQAVLFGCAVLAAQLTAVSADDLPSDLQKWWHYDSQGICTSYDLTNPKEKVSLCATKISGESSSCSTYKTSNVTKVVPRPWYRVDFDKSCIFIKDGSPVKGADTEGYFCRHPIPWTSVVNLQGELINSMSSILAGLSYFHLWTHISIRAQKETVPVVLGSLTSTIFQET